MRPLSLLTLLVLAIFALMVPSGMAISAGSAKNVLKIHNKYRAKHGSPPLKWSKTLEKYAQSWSNRCQFVHSGGKYGENLAYGYSDWSKAIGAWYNEESKYNYNKPGFSSGTGHFTALVWKSTTQLGCGVKQCANLNGAKLYTCSYAPPGNIVSKDNVYFVQNVLPPK